MFESVASRVAQRWIKDQGFKGLGWGEDVDVLPRAHVNPLVAKIQASITPEAP